MTVVYTRLNTDNRPVLLLHDELQQPQNIRCNFIFCISFFYYFTVLSVSYCISFLSCYFGSVSGRSGPSALINLI